MSETSKDSGHESGLNASLQKRTEEVYDTEHPSLPPAESASVQHEEGRAWPMIWLVVTIVCVLIGLWLLFF